MRSVVRGGYYFIVAYIIHNTYKRSHLSQHSSSCKQLTKTSRLKRPERVFTCIGRKHILDTVYTRIFRVLYFNLGFGYTLLLHSFVFVLGTMSFSKM